MTGSQSPKEVMIPATSSILSGGQRRWKDPVEREGVWW